MSDNDVVIREVEDAAAIARRNRAAKHDSARWVAGLTHVRQPHSEDGGVPATADDDERRGRRGPWLMAPAVALFTAAAAVFAVATLDVEATVRMDFPADELTVHPRLLVLTVTERALNILVHLVSVLVAGYVCTRLGDASNNFSLFLGVGMAGLGLVALAGDEFMLLRGCPTVVATVPDDKGGTTTKENVECWLPFVMHWVCATVKWAAAPTALIPAGLLFDRLPTVPGKNPLRTWVLPLYGLVAAVPLVLWGLNSFAAYMDTEYGTWAPLAVQAQGFAWCVLGVRCLRQAEFRAVRPKED